MASWSACETDEPSVGPVTISALTVEARRARVWMYCMIAWSRVLTRVMLVCESRTASSVGDVVASSDDCSAYVSGRSVCVCRCIGVCVSVSASRLVVGVVACCAIDRLTRPVCLAYVAHKSHQARTSWDRWDSSIGDSWITIICKWQAAEAQSGKPLAPHSALTSIASRDSSRSTRECDRHHHIGSNLRTVGRKFNAIEEGLGKEAIRPRLTCSRLPIDLGKHMIDAPEWATGV